MESALNPQEDFNNNNNIDTDVSPEKPKRSFAKYYKSEAVKRAKAKYYQKMKQDEVYMQNMRDRKKANYHKQKTNTEIETHLPNITALKKFKFFVFKKII